MESYQGDYYEARGGAWLIEKLGFARTQSLDLVNDPRYFTDNVINQRLTGFAAIAVVSQLLSGNAIGYVMSMDKYMDWSTPEGFCQFMAFFCITLVLFMSTLATYVGVAQPFHTLRLATAGSLGFEAAASYYLNENIVMWRHLAVKAMFWSLPLFVISQGFRVGVKFRRDNMKEVELPDAVPLRASIQAYGFAILFVLAALVLYLVHLMHYRVFNDRYKTLTIDKGYRQLTQTMMMPSVANFAGGQDGASDLDC